MIDWAAAAASIHAAFAEPILYSGAGLSDAEITAVPSDLAAPAFEGAGSTLRTLTFEIPKSLLPLRPRKGDQIRWNSDAYIVDDITERTDVFAWVLGVQL